MPPLSRRFAVVDHASRRGRRCPPALAAPTTPLVKAIDGVSTLGGKNTVILRFNESLDTHAEQYAAGVISILSGHKTTGFRELQAATNVETHVDELVGGADETLGVKVLPGPES